MVDTKAELLAMLASVSAGPRYRWVGTKNGIAVRVAKILSGTGGTGGTGLG
jgi:hypothetical protein